MKRYIHRFIPVIIMGTGMALFLPVLQGGFFLDDYYHLLVLEGGWGISDAGVFDLFTFAEGRPDRMGPVQGDFLPWWAADDLRIDFFRPLCCLLHAVDHQVHGKDPTGYHWTNLLLWGVLLGVVALFYRRLGGKTGSGPATALVAGMFFAVSEIHVVSVFWPASRPVLLGVMFITASLFSYHRYRSGGGMRHLVTSSVVLAAGLFANESVTSVVSWVAAYELCLGRGSVRHRVRCGLPLVLITVVYLVFYTLSGHGVHATGAYTMPFSEPVNFLETAFTDRIPRMLVAVLTLVRVDSMSWVIWLVGASCILVLLPHLMRDRVARFMGIGAVLSLVPLASADVADRVLSLPILGTAWVLGSCVVATVSAVRAKSCRRNAWRWPGFLIALLIVVVHGLISPCRVPGTIRGISAYSDVMLQSALTAEMPAAGLEEARVLLLTTPDTHLATFFPAVRAAAGLPMPGGVWPITTRSGGCTISCAGPGALVMKAESPGFLSSKWARLFRREMALAAGATFTRGALKVTVNTVERGEIREIRVETDCPMDDPGVWLLVWRDGKWRRLETAGHDS